MPSLASLPQTAGEAPASVPRIVLPITSRGLVVTDRMCWGILFMAMAVAAGLILYLNRGTVFYLDELGRVLSVTSLTPGEVLEPHEGHLTATSNLVFKALLEVFGADYLAWRILAISAVLLSAGLFYTLVKRRIGALPALAPTLVLLFLGSAWEMVVIPWGFNTVFSVASGLAALLALERGDSRGDLAACVLICVSVATLSVGLAFLAGVAVAVLLAPDRRRRAWIFLVPLALYVAWFAWSLSSAGAGDSEAKASNLLLIPGYVFDSLAAVMAGITGLGYDFTEGSLSLEFGWGRILAAAAIVAIVIRLRRGAVPPLLWVGLAVVVAYWTLGALVVEPETKQAPGEVRYVYAGSVGVLLVTAAASTRVLFSKPGLIGLFAVCAFSLATNLALLRDGGGAFRNDYSAPLRAELATLELARDQLAPDRLVALSQFEVVTPASAYFDVVDRYGSPAFSPTELERQVEVVRVGADERLAALLDLHLEQSRDGPPGPCRQLTASAAGAPLEFILPPGGASIRAEGGPANVAIGRFGAPSVDAGTFAPGEAGTLAIPPDSAPAPWRASVTGVSAIETCAV